MIKHTCQTLFFAFLFCFFASVSHAQISAPRMINFQGVLVDEGGNVLYDIQQADIRCSVVDGAGTVLYEEIQPDTTLVSGAISILCGNGIDPNTGVATGGIPYNVFSPEGSRLLSVQVNDSIPQEEVEIVSVPYSYYSQLALGLANPLEADDITSGVIARTHLHDDLWNDIMELGFGEGALDAHRTESGAHPATSILVENTFVNAPGTNLQQVLQGIDTAISVRTNQDEVLGTRIGDETAAREAADAAETAAREAAIRAEEIAREAADNVERAAREAADAAHARTNIDAAHPGNLPTSRLSGQITNSQIANNAVTSSKIHDGTITTNDMTTANISQWTNDVGYITDGNQGWNNSYGFITSSDASNIADSRISTAINNNTIPNTAAEIGAAPAGHTHSGVITSYQVLDHTCRRGEDMNIGGSCFEYCPEGTRIVGGGCFTIDSCGPNLQCPIVGSYPDLNVRTAPGVRQDRWICSTVDYNDGGTWRTVDSIHMYAICLEWE